MDLLRRVAGWVVVVMVMVACDQGAPSSEKANPVPSRITHVAPDKPRRPQERKATRPELRIDNQGHTGPDRVRVQRAIRTLEELGFWDELTGHLHTVIVRTRPGERRKPLDGHLADSLYTARIGPGPDGLVCDIVIFSEALADDVEVQNSNYERGAVAVPAPSLKQFWAVILAHELAHCTTPGQRGERRSTRWEHRVLRAMGVGGSGP